MKYINFKSSQGIETIECLDGLKRAERKRLLAEYRLVSDGYYFSSRATKQYYLQNKAV